MPTIALVGKPYISFIRYVAEHRPDIKLVAFQDHRDSFTYPENVTRILPLDFSSSATVVDGLKALPELTIDGVISSYENSNLPLVWIGNYFGCSVPSEGSILAATDKNIMRQKFMAFDPAITPHFAQVTTWSDVEQFIAEHQFPLVLKPANLMKSLLVSINHNQEELRHSFEVAQKSINQLYQQHGVHHRQPTLVLEEFLDGSSHSIDIITDAQGNYMATPVVDYVTARQLGIEDSFVYARFLPSKLPKNVHQAVTDCAIQGVKALGLTSIPAHVEVIVTAQGPKIVEIGARFGGYRPRMYELHTGLEIHRAMIDLALGQPLTIATTKLDYVATFELFPTEEGKLKTIVNFDQAKQLKSFFYASQPKHAGDMVGLSANGYKFAANIMLHSANKAQFDQDCAFIQEHVVVEVEKT